MQSVIRLLGSCAIALAITGLSGRAAQASQPPESLKPGIQAYNARHYGQAVTQLRAVTGSDADNPYTHYYLALSYQGLGQFAQAEKEYRWNYDRGSDKDLRYKSWQGLLGLANARSSRTVASSTASGSSSLPSTSNTGSDGVGGSNIAGASASGNSGGTNNPATGSRKGKYILDGSTRAHVSNPFQMEWIPGCPRHR